MKRLKLDDSDIMPMPTQLTMEVVEIDHRRVVECGMFSDYELPGEGFYLSPQKAKKLYVWLRNYLRSINDGKGS